MDPKTINNPISYIVATLAIEGLSPSQEAINLCEKLVEGKMTAEEAENAIFEKYGFYFSANNA